MNGFRLFLHLKMNLHVNHRIDRFCIAGISYRKADFHVRGRFSVDGVAKAGILADAAAMGLKSMLIVSTCNRTELYGYAPFPQMLGMLLVKHAGGGTMEELQEYGYFLRGFEALNHAFKVGAGLDSQIIGDFEIAGQIKQALAFSQKHGMVGPILDRTFNFILQASKKVKNRTALSAGTVSVSFAAIEWLKHLLNGDKTSVLVIGAGKFGANVMKNLLHYLPGSNVAVSNRTSEKAAEIAAALPVEVVPFDAIATRANEFEVIITCTNAPHPLIHAEYFSGEKRRLLIDLSVPANIHGNVKELAGVHLVNVDDISAMLDHTISRRMADVPKAEAIIAKHISDFYEWLNTFRHAPLIHEMKQKLLMFAGLQNGDVKESNQASAGANAGGYEDSIQDTVASLMVNLKTRREKGCQMIAAYHNFFTMSNNVGIP
jgi:glutamyl-tRNA reductase